VSHVFPALARGAAFIQSARRKCLILYDYFMDRDFGLIQVRLQTWCPLPLQVYVNGHEWLARKLAQHGVRDTKHDNAFLWLEDCTRAQRVADRFVSLPWVARLDRNARRVPRLLADVLSSMAYYWVTTQAEYATDLVFKSRQPLAEFFPRLLEHSTLSFSARDVLSFLGRKWHGKVDGGVVTDQFDHGFNGRLHGRRVKHRMKRNWLKMYEKAGWILRGETVINDPEEFRVRRPGAGAAGAGPAADRMGAAQDECGVPLPLPRRAPARAAGASPPLAIESWAPRSDSAGCTFARSTPRLREEIGKVQRKNKEPTTEESTLPGTVNGQPAMLLVVFRQPSANIIETVDRARGAEVALAGWRKGGGRKGTVRASREPGGG
jgi:hypothetical protein